MKEFRDHPSDQFLEEILDSSYGLNSVLLSKNQNNINKFENQLFIQTVTVKVELKEDKYMLYDPFQSFVSTVCEGKWLYIFLNT